MSIIKRKFTRHIVSALETASHLVTRPFELILLVLMVGVTMSLPIALYAGIYNIEQHAGEWGAKPHVTLIMKGSTNRSEIEAIVENLEENALFEATEIIDPEQALSRLNEVQDMQGVVDVLQGDNPLPYSLVLVLRQTLRDNEIELLRENLLSIAIVDDVLIDVAWMQQLNSSVRFGRMIMIVLAIVLCIGVVLVVGNAIRAKTSERMDEMEILTRMGAARSFVCRPYLYSGIFIGFIGALVGTVLVDILLRVIRTPLAKLAAQYEGNLEIYTIPAIHVLGIAGLGGFLGWLAAFLTSHGALNRLDLD